MNRFLHELALGIPCPRCQAEPYDGCVTRTGGRAHFLHAWRMEPIARAFNSGYHTAYQEAVDTALDNPEGWTQWIARELRQRQKAGA